MSQVTSIIKFVEAFQFAWCNKFKYKFVAEGKNQSNVLQWLGNLVNMITNKSFWKNTQITPNWT